MLKGVIHRFKVAFTARDIYVAAHNLRNRQKALGHYMVHVNPEETDAYQTQLHLAAWDADVLRFFNGHCDTLERMAVWPDLNEANRLLAQIQRLYAEGEILWVLLSE